MIPSHMATMTVTRISDGVSFTMNFDMEYTAQATFDKLEARYPGTYECDITITRGASHVCPEEFELEFAMIDMQELRNSVKP